MGCELVYNVGEIVPRKSGRERQMVTFEQVYQLAEQLPLTEQLRLMAQLRQKVSRSSGSVTREQLLAEFERKKQSGVFENAESLYGKYANPDADVSSEELGEFVL